MHLATPILKTQILDSRSYWRAWEQNKKNRSVLKGNGRVASNSLEVNFSKFTPDNYLLSWATAVAGIETESDGHTIVVPHNKWVNHNANAWLNEVLLESYNSFILAENYLEHIQVPELSKGKILDAVAWVVEKQFNGYKEPIPTVFIDCLVATDKKKHPKLVNSITSGALNTTSMGCLLPTGKVTLADGTQREIQTIQEGDFILTGEGRVRRVSKVMIRDVVDEPMYHTQIWGVREGLDLTGEHPLKMAYGPKQDVKEHTSHNLKIPHTCSSPTPAFNFYRMDSQSTYKKTEDTQRAARGPRNLYVQETYPREIWLPSEQVTEDFAELLGMLAGDGILRTDLWQSIELQVQNAEIKISARGRQLIHSLCGDYTDTLHRESDKVSVLLSKNKIILNQLKKFLLGRNAQEKKFSTEVLYWPHHLQKALLRGYFNTDGDVSKKIQTKGESRSKDLRDQIYLMVLRQGALANKGSVLHKPTGYSQGKEPYLMHVVTVAKSYSDSWLSDKLPVNHQGTDFTRETFFAQGGVARTVRSVTASIYTGQVYNLEVEEDHTYLHNGITVHNCDILYFQCSRCGRIFEEGYDEPCFHLKNQLGKVYYDKNNKKRKVVELCGAKGKAGSCVFKELSWVLEPAFAWAKLHGFVPTSKKTTNRPMIARVPRERYKEAARESDDWDLITSSKRP